MTDTTTRQWSWETVLYRQCLLGPFRRQLSSKGIDVEGQYGVAAQEVGKFGEPEDSELSQRGINVAWLTRRVWKNSLA